MKKFTSLVILLLIIAVNVNAQDTVVVQTFDYESTSRDSVFQFPSSSNDTYEKIIMQYSMRCKDGLVSTGAARNRGCGEWDYSCNTYVTDSSRIDSIKATHPSHIISNFNGITFNLSKLPTYTFYQYKQKEVTYTSTISELKDTIGTGTDLSTYPFSTKSAIGKTQYLILASEVTGLTTNSITGLKLDVSSIGSDVQFLRIKMKNTTQVELDSNDVESELKEVYFLNTKIASTGVQDFNFYAPFDWDGTSNILVEFSFKNGGEGINTEVKGSSTSFSSVLYNKSNTDYFITLNGSENIEVPTSSMSSILDEITVAFWTFGDPENLPKNTSIFEAVDANNRRQLNVHLPWSDSRVYWDCGNSGSGYDRIDKASTAAEFSGGWNHWAFTKNTTTGRMMIYLNGKLWHSETRKFFKMDIQKFKIGSSVSGNNYYNGKLDEFSVWNAELSQTEIESIMHNDVDASHPKYSNLLAYYQFNEGKGKLVQDASTFGLTADLSGVSNWGNLRGNDLFRNFVTSKERPNLILVEGTYTTEIKDTVLLDSIINTVHEIKSYDLIGNDLIQPVDTSFQFMAGYADIIDDSSGKVVDSVFYATDSSINITTYDYFAKSPAKFEIMSFVTPYGIGIDFGMEGKTWSFDVTDFGPILNGSKRVSIERRGNRQEEMDIRFLFIKGTPSREVLDINQIWPVRNNEVSYTRILDDSEFEPRDISLLPNASGFKIRTAITGHGQQGEFNPQTHFINLNGGNNELEWRVLTECANNPIFPQGGTWVYDRAGWCPGAPTDVEDLDVTQYVTAANSITVDYGINYNVVISPTADASRYIVNSQLVSYGAPNFTLDAAISDIISPSMTVEYGRFNPICGKPVIKIKNNGSAVLTDLDISYGVEGGIQSDFVWTGSLNFLEEEEITLPPLPVENPGKNKFVVSISNPNNSVDEYDNNNQLSSIYDFVPRYEKEIVISMRTNNAANETSWVLTDMNDNKLASRVGGLSANRIYRDTVKGLSGCFKLQITDSDDDGISWWANNDGNGYVTIKNVGQAEVTLATDFGRQINYQFIAGDPVGIKDNVLPFQAIDLYPNPTAGTFTLEIDGNQKNVDVQMINQTGQVLYQKNYSMINGFLKTTVDLSDKADGLYFVILTGDDGKMSTRKLIKN